MTKWILRGFFVLVVAVILVESLAGITALLNQPSDASVIGAVVVLFCLAVAGGASMALAKRLHMKGWL